MSADCRKNKTIVVRFEPRETRRLRRLAKKTGLTLSQILRLAVTRYLDRAREKGVIF